MSLRIGFDAIRALHNTTGLGNYARGVLRGLYHATPQHALHLYSPKPAAAAFRDFPAEIGAALHRPTDASTPVARATWRTFRLGRAAARDEMQLYHGLTHEIPRDLPRTGVPSVVTFADLIYEKHPEYFPLFDRWSYRWRYRWSARHADAIVAISAQTRDDLVECYGIDAARITVVPPARDAAFGIMAPNTERALVRAKYALPSEFVLSVGTLEPRKNHDVLLRSLANIRPAQAPPLVLVGRDGGSMSALEATIRRLGLGERVVVRTDVSTPDLPALMQCASLFLYPSRVEGFGMPIVEALSAGVPVVATRGGCLVEAGGPGSRYVGGDDVDGWATAITELVADNAARASMRAAGHEHARHFDRGRVAARLLGVYDAVMANRGTAS